MSDQPHLTLDQIAEVTTPDRAALERVADFMCARESNGEGYVCSETEKYDWHLYCAPCWARAVLRGTYAHSVKIGAWDG